MRDRKLPATALLAVALLVSGCTADRSSVETNPAIEAGNEEELLLEWWPSAGASEFASLIEIEAASETSCRSSGAARGGMVTEDGLGAIVALRSPDGGITSAAARADGAAAHVGPVNSARLLGPGLSQSFGWFYNWSSGSSNVVNLQAGFDLDPWEEEPPFAHAQCDSSEARIRLYTATDIVPILSAAATGGAGLEVGLPAVTPTVGINNDDLYSLTTEADVVVLLLMDVSAPVGADPMVQGELVIRTPESQEVVSLDEPRQMPLLRAWQGGGTYEVELDRIAINKIPLVGVLAGFVLADELGDLPVGGPAIVDRVP